MRKIIIFGGNGLIGKELIKSLNQQACYKIYNIDKSEIDLSVQDNIKLLKSTIDKIIPDVSIVLAATKRQKQDDISIRKSNDIISHNLSNSLSNKSGKVIYISSCAVYGEKNNQINYNENSKINPTSSYGEHKIYSESLYQNLIEPDKLIILRPPLIYSMNDKEGYHPGGFLNQAKQDNLISIWGKGNELREFIWVNEAVKIISNLLNTEFNGILNLTSGKSYSYKSIVNHISKISNCKIKYKDRTGPLVDHIYDNSKLRRIIENFEFSSPIQVINSMKSEKH